MSRLLRNEGAVRTGAWFVALFLLAGLWSVLSGTPAKAQGGVVLFRVNAGGPTVAAIDGDIDWEADNYFNTGNTSSHSVGTFDPSVPLATTPTDLFQTERWDPSASPELVYAFPTGAGTYEVRLFFADGFSGTALPGDRVFDVSIEGDLVLDNYDIIADVGDQTGVMKSFVVASDATLNITFGHVVENPQINAIEILSADAEGYLAVSPNSYDFGLTEIGVPSVQSFTLENLGSTADIAVDPISLGGDFSASQPQVVLGPGEATDVDVTFTPAAAGVATETWTITHDGTNSPVEVPLQGEGYDPANAPIAFDSTGLAGLTVNDPTSLEFGPDGRLYVSQQDGTILAITVQRNSSTDYVAVASETINQVKNNVPNFNDNGTPNSTQQRQVTGIMTAGTAANPVLYVTSSDWRIAVGTDEGLDTNSGVITRLTWNGSSWDEVDIVRGLPRSEENHSVNGLDWDPVNNVLYVAIGGNTNKGAPSANFSGTPEYALAAALLSIDLDVIESMPVYTDQRNGRQFIFDLPTLDDPTRPNIDNSSPDFPYPSGHPLYEDSVDPGDPFGGNNGLNQAMVDLSGPVQVYSPGYRNAYDVLFTDDGRLYTYDNGPNTGWGGLPINEGPAGNCTNELNEDGSTGYGDGLHFVTQGYYGGHPNPTRGNPSGSNLYYYEEISGTWTATAVYDWTTDFPAPPVPLSAANPVECDFLIPGSENGALALVGASTNGIAEYTATNFGGAMQGDVLAASFNGNIYRYQFNATGDEVTDSEVLFSGFGSQPLDVTTQGDGDVFPGTVWAATYGASAITVFEPVDFGSCSGDDDPALDEDGDGYDNADEIDNGTNPCSGGSVPPDNDGDFTSDLNDDDDDNDAILDVNDHFAIDPDNGNSTVLPLSYPLFNNEPGTGFFGLGFTGLMLNNSAPTDYLTQYDADNLAAGGASGKLTIEEIPAGTALGGANTQQYAFQFGVDVDGSTAPFLVRTRVEPPFFGVNGSPTTPQDSQSFGMFIGAGDQDNYLQIVFNAQGGAGGIEVLLEESGATSASAQYGAGVVGDILNASSVDLYLAVDPAAGTAQPYVQLGVEPMVSLGAPLAIPASWLDSNDAYGLAVGVIATSAGSGTPFSATWDYFHVTYLAPDELGASPASVDFGRVSEGDVSAIEVVNLENLGIAADPDITVNDVVVTGADAADFAVTFAGPVTLGPAEATALDVVCSPTDSGTRSAALEVTHTGTNSPLLVPLACEGKGTEIPLYRINVGGPEAPAADGSSPPWAVDTLANPSSYIVGSGGGDIFTASSGNAHPGAIDMSDPSLPPGAPVTIFETERYDVAALPEMVWAFPVSGTVEVRLFFAELFSGVDQVGERIFDVTVEGVVPPAFDNIDQYAVAGPKGAFMRSTTITVTDGMLDLEFIHVVENPALKGIEIIGETPLTNPSAFIEVTPGQGLGASTFNGGSFTIENTGDVDITGVTLDLRGSYLPDVVFDPVGTAGDATAKCLTADSGAAATGYVTPADNCVDPFSAPHNGVDNQEGYDVASMSFDDFNNGESFAFSVDIDPTSIKNDVTAGDAGSVSGFELIGALVTVEFADGSVLTNTLYDEGSLGGSAVTIAPAAPAAPAIGLLGYPALPVTVTNASQTVVVTGTAGAEISLLQVDAHLYIDAGGGGYDIDPFEANSAMARVLYSGTLPGGGVLQVPVTLLQSPGSGGAPDGGLNHFLAVVVDPTGQTSPASNSFVVAYDPTFDSPPELTLLGDNPLTLEVGTPFSDPGATATDAEDGDLTGSIITDTTALDVSVLGSYPVTYTVTDSGNNTVMETRTVDVVDNTPPLITLQGSNPYTITVDTVYVDPGASASDNYDTLVPVVVDDSAVVTGTIGSYVVTYNATDSSGNQAVEVTRTVNVVPEAAEFEIFLPLIRSDAGTAGRTGAENSVGAASLVATLPCVVHPGSGFFPQPMTGWCRPSIPGLPAT